MNQTPGVEPENVDKLFQKEQKFQYPLTEKIIIAVALIQIIFSITLFFTNASFRYYFFKTAEDELFSVPLGKVTLVDGTVSREKAGEGEFRSLSKDDLLYPMDSVMTGSGSAAILELNNGDKIELKQNSLVRLAFSFDFSLGVLIPKKFLESPKPKLQVMAGEVKSYKPVEKIPVYVPPKKKEIEPLVITLLSPPQDTEFVLNSTELKTGKKTVKLEFVTNRLPDPLTLVLKRVKDGSELQNMPLEINKKEFILPVDIGNPGEYNWALKNAAGKILAQSRFRINPYVQQMIKVKPVSGAHNKLVGLSTTRDFDGFSLGWITDYPLEKPVYRLTIYEEKGRKIVSQTTVKAESYVFNKGKITFKQYSYLVEEMLASGFILVSNEEKFGLKFLPPDPVSPANKAQVSLGSLPGQVKRVYFTWSKTNFTNTYDLEISTSADFSALTLKRQLKDNFYLWSDPKPSTYYWRIKSNHPDQSSAFTEPFVVEITQ